MITRPLELSSRLRPEPRTFDWVFYVNGGLIVLFFSLFGSQFVLAPGLGDLERGSPEPFALFAEDSFDFVLFCVRRDLSLTLSLVFRYPRKTRVNSNTMLIAAEGHLRLGCRSL